jgi:hypothetical protein
VHQGETQERLAAPERDRRSRGLSAVREEDVDRVHRCFPPHRAALRDPIVVVGEGAIVTSQIAPFSELQSQLRYGIEHALSQYLRRIELHRPDLAGLQVALGLEGRDSVVRGGLLRGTTLHGGQLLPQFARYAEDRVGRRVVHVGCLARFESREECAC